MSHSDVIGLVGEYGETSDIDARPGAVRYEDRISQCQLPALGTLSLF